MISATHLTDLEASVLVRIAQALNAVWFSMTRIATEHFYFIEIDKGVRTRVSAKKLLHRLYILLQSTRSNVEEGDPFGFHSIGLDAVEMRCFKDVLQRTFVNGTFDFVSIIDSLDELESFQSAAYISIKQNDRVLVTLAVNQKDRDFAFTVAMNAKLIHQHKFYAFGCPASEVEYILKSLDSAQLYYFNVSAVALTVIL
jgi:hypothetical protein